MRDLTTLPKAHIHLHFTGSMSTATLETLAQQQGVVLPSQLIDHDPLSVPATKRGWGRFQRSYDLARKVVRGEAALRTVLAAAVADDAAESSRRLEIQVDPTSYAPSVGGIVAALEIILDQAQISAQNTGIEIGIIVAASRIRHPLEARTLARLAARHAGENAGEVVGFGLNNDERYGNTSEWEGAFRIARNAGLACVPHGGELRGAGHIQQIIRWLQPTRIGHGVRAVEDQRVLDDLVSRGISLEVCPASNVQLGVFPNPQDVPLRKLISAGATVALGADDPLLFLSRLNDQYQIAREHHGLNDNELAELARSSIKASLASAKSKQRWLLEVDEWLKVDPQ
ncbi:MAG: adenosine deaminase [Propionibacteriaceae bacterium]